MVQGPMAYSRELPQPSTTDGYYKDVSALAFPLGEYPLLAMDKAGCTLTGSSTSSPEFLALQFPNPLPQHPFTSSQTASVIRETASCRPQRMEGI